MISRIFVGATALALLSEPASAQSLDDVAAGSYSLDKTHAYLTFEISHNGLSDYTVSFTDYDASLEFDPVNPEASLLRVAINPMALETNYPDAEKREEWHAELSTDDRFLNGDEFPEITFVSTSIDETSATSGAVTGDLTFRGVTKPLTLNVTFNGAGNLPWLGDRDVLGFDADVTFNRSDFGMEAMIPTISDAVTVRFSGEFQQDE